MSKRSKQERAKRYVEGAREEIRLAALAAEAEAATLEALREELNTLGRSICAITDWNKAAKDEVTSLETVLGNLHGRRSALETQLSELESRVETANGTLHATADAIRGIFAEPDDAPETTTPAVESA